MPPTLEPESPQPTSTRHNLARLELRSERAPLLPPTVEEEVEGGPRRVQRTSNRQMKPERPPRRKRRANKLQANQAEAVVVEIAAEVPNAMTLKALKTRS